MNTHATGLRDSSTRLGFHPPPHRKTQIHFAKMTEKGKKTKIVAKDLHLLWIFARKCDRD